jgi:hypothetical protein
LKYLIILILIFTFKLAKCQVDSIEYNIWEQIYDFKIEQNKYWFKDFINGRIIESDSIIFQPSTYFSNFTNNQKSSDYSDSVQLAIVSRTLKGYNEDVLYNKKQKFIRICWFKKKEPIVFRIGYLNDNVFIVFKKGNGSFETKGILIKDTTFILQSKQINKLNTLMFNANLLKLRNSAICPDPIIHMPNLFFVEINIENRYNVFTMSDCNLETSENKPVFKLLQYLVALVKDKTDIKYKGFW